MGQDYESSMKAPAGRSIDTVSQALTQGVYASMAEPLPPLPGNKVAALVSHKLGRTSSSNYVDSLNEDGTERGWQDGANCLGVDPDLFFPERGASTHEAKEVCKGCIVREDCLEYALANGEKFGIWGGLSERERRRIRKQRSVARRSALDATASVDGLDT